MQSFLWRKNKASSSIKRAHNNSAREVFERGLFRSIAIFLMVLVAPEIMADGVRHNEIKTFNIPQQRADLALTTLAEQANLTLIFPYEKVSNITAHALVGDYSIEDAVQLLLQDTGLKLVVNDNDQLTIIQNNGELDPMHQKSKLSTAIVAILAAMFGANSTYAQESEMNSAVAVEKQAEKAKQDALDSVEEVMVTGIRASLEKAQDIKKKSDSIVDAIVAEDIGKLPDQTAAESLAHIAGVQVSRFNDEANEILIRGLPDVTTTYNGREFFTAELRRSQLQDFPAQAISGIVVYKAATAEVIEPGMAGLVDVKTRRPFDIEGQKIHAGLHTGYNDQGETTSPSGSFLYSNRWDTSAGEMGVLGNITYANTKYYNGARWNSVVFPAVGNWLNIEAPYSAGGFFMPDAVGFYNSSGDRDRPSGNASFQWSPTDNLELYADVIYQGYSAETMQDNFWIRTQEFDWLNGTGQPSLNNIVMVEGSDNAVVSSVTKSGGIPAQGFRSTRKEKTDTYQYAIGAKWESDSLKLSTDLAYTDSEHHNTEYSWDSGLSFSPTVNISFYGDDDGVLFEPVGWDAGNLETYEVRGYWESKYNVAGSGIQWRLDADYDTGLSFLPELKAGIRYSSRDASRESGNRYAWFWNLHQSYDEVGFLDFERTFNPIRTGAAKFTTWMAPTYDSIQANRAQLVEWAHTNALNSWDAWRAPAWETLEVPTNPAEHWNAEEDVYSAYLQAKAHFDVASFPVDIHMGARISQTDSYNKGYSSVFENGVTAITPREATDSYVDVLPNINIRAELLDNVQLRAAYTETRTKPNFNDMNPALNISMVTTGGGVQDPNAPAPAYDATGWGGNADLKPFTAHNYDLGLEYYFSKTGYVSFTSFRKDLWGYIGWYQRTLETQDYGTVLLNHPENAGEGKLNGWELNASSTFDYDFVPAALRGFGATFNVTHLVGQNRQPTADGSFGDFKDIPGLSKYTYNATVFYETPKFGGRLSYNSRDKWVNWYGNINGTEEGFFGSKTEKRDRLDLSVRYTFTDNLDLYIDVANILAKPFKNYTADAEGRTYYQDVRDEGRYLGMGLSIHY